MKTNAAGQKLIREFEGYSLEAYPDPLSKLAIELRKPSVARCPNWLCLPGDPWTIGIGATGPGIGPGLVWTPDQVEGRFEADLRRFERIVSRALRFPVNENQFSALVAFTFNVGEGNLLYGGPNKSRCTLLRKLDAGDTLGAAAEFEKWDNQCNPRGCVEVAGLVRRRLAEQRLFLTPVDGKQVA